MSELRKCSRCTSTIELKYFAINRQGEHYKCCDNCRNKTPTVVKPHDITAQHYADIDNELRAEYETQFNKKSRDYTM